MTSNAQTNIQHEEQFEVKECNEKLKLKTEECDILRKQLRNLEEELRRKNDQLEKLNADIQRKDEVANEVARIMGGLESKLRCEVASKTQEEGITVMGLSPSMLTDKQRDIYNNYKHVIIHGVAGSGKTTLILLKIIELAKMGSQKILLLAQSPHHLRCQKVLESNNVTVNAVDKFPSIPLYSPLTSSVVIVMTPEDYFRPDANELEGILKVVDAEFHIFVDDLHMHEKLRGIGHSDVGHYLVGTQRPTHYLWIGIDPTDKSTPELDVLFEREKLEEEDWMPLYHLTQVVRDTTDKMVRFSAELRKKELSDSMPKKIPRNIQVGPTIRSDPLMWHMLTVSGDDDGDSYTSKLKEFFEERIDEELGMLLNQSPTLQPSDIAIIFDDEEDFNHPDVGVILVDRCLNKHSKAKQTILEQICNNDADKVIVDVSKNMASFDCHAVILISDRITYRGVTRGKRSLAIIYRNYDQWNNVGEYDNSCLVKWQRIDDKFCKITKSSRSRSSSS